MNDLGLVEAAAANNVAAFEAVARHATWPGGGQSRRFGSVAGVVTGHPRAFWNPVIAVTPRSQTVDTLAAASWVRSHGVPCSVFVDLDRTEVGIGRAIAALRLEADPWPMPVMALTRIPKPPSVPEGLRIDEVVDAAAHEDFLRALVGSDDREVLERAGRTISPSIARDRDVRLLVGRVDGAAVATSLAFRTGDVVGIYVVGTQDAYRKRGIGTAMTWAALAAGRRWGCRTGVLQASEMGAALYRAMGFRTIAHYTEYGPPE